MKDSKFCLAPSGMGFSTRTYESVAQGCVPLIIQDEPVSNTSVDQARATSYKLQVTSYKLQATSYKLQVTSYKLQVTSYKVQVTGAAGRERRARHLTRNNGEIGENSFVKR